MSNIRDRSRVGYTGACSGSCCVGITTGAGSGDLVYTGDWRLGDGGGINTGACAVGGLIALSLGAGVAWYTGDSHLGVSIRAGVSRRGGVYSRGGVRLGGVFSLLGGVFCWYGGVFCRYVGVFCLLGGVFRWYGGVFCRYVGVFVLLGGVFCRYGGVFCRYGGAFCRYLGVSCLTGTTTGTTGVGDHSAFWYGGVYVCKEYKKGVNNCTL